MLSLSSLSKCFQIGAALACISTMIGCGAAGVFPESTALDTGLKQAEVGSISGNNYGGHAPLVGAHIYLVQPGTTGYGSVVTGLLSAGGTSTYPTTANGSWTNSGFASDQFVPATDAAGKTFYGVTTNANGEFNITGDYTCTVGRPVILIAYGGSPSFVGQGTGSTPTTQTNTFPISSVVVSNLSGQGSGTGTATYTFNIGGTTPELFYPGETVTLSGVSINANSGGSPTLLDGQALTVSATGLTTTSFQTTFTADYGGYPTAASPYYPAGTTTQSAGATVTANPPFNPAAVNVALLGICPSSGNFSTGASAIKYVYMNEISTAAFAYAMNQYANWTVNDQSGNDEFHIGSPNTTQALQGIANAAIAAGNLYDIQGGNQSTTFAGEGHIARSVTPNGGSGTVPQSLLDTLGNTLAACVDSNNTYRAGTGTQSSQCLILDQYAQDNGVYDTTATTHQAFNIVQAALNIAHYPQGAGTGTTACGCYGGTQTVTAGTATTARSYVTALTNLPTGNVPFAPYLASPPNDFAVAIQWNVGQTANDVQIDATGNAWAVAGANGMYEITPAAAVSNYTGTLTTTSKNLGSVAIDAVNGNIWANGTTGIYKYTAGNATGTLIGTGNSTSGTSIALDSSLNQYIGSGGAQAVGSSIVKQNAAGTAAGGNFPILTGGVANSPGICANAVGYVALDTTGNLWTATSNDIFNGNPYVCRFDSNGNLKYSLAVPTAVSGQAGGFGYPHGMATDSANNAFFPDKNLDALYKVAVGTTTNNSGYTSVTLHGQLNAPKGVAVDGANTLWVANTGNLLATTGAKYATGLVQFTNALALVTPSYITGAAYSTTPTTGLGSVAIDPSGNVWSVQAQIDGGAAPTQVFEYIGLGSPTVTPLAAAKAGSLVGVRP